jgi:hypothetical protein
VRKKLQKRLNTHKEVGITLLPFFLLRRDYAI